MTSVNLDGIAALFDDIATPVILCRFIYDVIHQVCIRFTIRIALILSYPLVGLHAVAPVEVHLGEGEEVVFFQGIARSG